MRGRVLGSTAALLMGAGVAFSQTEAELAVSPYPDAKPGMVCLTFDDGTRDHYTRAAPLLERYGYRGIFSVVPDLIGHGRYMGWEHVRNLAERGHEIANHSLSHLKLSDLLEAGDTNALDRQIRASADVIEQMTGTRPRVFCFPYTALNEELNALVRESGQEPMLRLRFVFMHDTTTDELDAYLDNVATNGLYKGLLFHGVDPRGRGWEALRDPDAFEAMLKTLKAREADIHVGRYSENARYLALRDAVDIACVENDPDAAVYRLVPKSGAPLPEGGARLTLVLLHPERCAGVQVDGHAATLRRSARGAVFFEAEPGKAITVLRRR